MSSTRSGSMKIRLVILLACPLAAAQIAVSVDAVVHEGEKLVQKGQLADAQQLYQKALTRFPGDRMLQSELGMVFFQENDWPNAIEYLAAGSRGTPNSVDLLFYLSYAYFANSQIKLARETIAKAAALHPKDARVCQKYGEYLTLPGDQNEEGLPWLEKARRLDPNLARIDFEIGAAQLARENYQAAAENLESAQKKAPEDGHIAFMLGESWAGLSKWDKACDSYKYALAHGSADAPTYYGLGEALRATGNPAGSLEPLQKALSLQPALNEAHLQLGKAYRDLGRISEAEHENVVFITIKERTPRSALSDSVDEKQSWEDLKQLLEGSKEQEALDYLAHLPGPGPVNFPNPSYVLGVEYFRMGRNEDAKRWLLNARSETPTAAVIPAHLGLVEMTVGNLAGAEEWFQSGLRLDPADQLSLAGFGELRYLQKQWAEAIDYLEKSKTSDPYALLMLSDAYFQVGKSDQAMITAQVARALGSSDKALLKTLDRLLEAHKPQ
jgi:tetratricopeptide (TPR) repeat protein